MTFILNSFAGRLVKSICPGSLSGVVWVILDWIQFYCLFMAVEVVVGSWHMCQLREQCPFLLAGRIALLCCLCRLPTHGEQFLVLFPEPPRAGQPRALRGEAGCQVCSPAITVTLRALSQLPLSVPGCCALAEPLTLARGVVEEALCSCCGCSHPQAAPLLWWGHTGGGMDWTLFITQMGFRVALLPRELGHLKFPSLPNLLG